MLAFQLFLEIWKSLSIAKNTGDLQKALDALGDFCEQWKITVNVSKTKIIIL